MVLDKKPGRRIPQKCGFRTAAVRVVFVVQFEHGESPGKVRVILWQDHLQGIRIGDFQVDGSDG